MVRVVIRAMVRGRVGVRGGVRARARARLGVIVRGKERVLYVGSAPLTVVLVTK
jgi:hypothetical protein